MYSKFFTRISVVLVSLYSIISYIAAILFSIDILYNFYIILFELCIVCYTFESGKYHCRFIRWTALSILVCDIISHTDYHFDYISPSIYNLIPLTILFLGITTSLTLALNHFYKVSKLKRKN